MGDPIVTYRSLQVAAVGVDSIVTDIVDVVVVDLDFGRIRPAAHVDGVPRYIGEFTAIDGS